MICRQDRCAAFSEGKALESTLLLESLIIYIHLYMVLSIIHIDVAAVFGEPGTNLLK